MRSTSWKESNYSLRSPRMNSLSLQIMGAVEFGDTVVGKQTRRDVVTRVALSKDLASATLVISLGDRASKLLESHCVLVQGV